MRSRSRLVILVVALFLWTTEALALDVLLVRPPDDDTALFEAFGRLRAELELQGFDVLVLAGSTGRIEPNALEIEAQKRDAFAAVALQRDEDGTTAQVHIVDRVTGKTISRRLKISKASDGPLLLAIRAADLLRASLMELAPGQSPPDDVVDAEQSPPPREVVRFSRKVPRFQIAAGPLLLWHPRLGASWGGTIEFNTRPHPRIVLGLNLGGPALGGEFRVDDNNASVRQEFALLRGFYNLRKVEPGSRWEWGPTAQLGVVHVAASGSVEPPLVAQSANMWALGLGGGVALDVYFNGTVSIGGRVDALGLIPQPVVAIDDARSVPIGVQGMSSLHVGVSF